MISSIRFALFAVFITWAPLLKAQAINANSIKGIWLSEEKDGKIEIYQSDNKFWGKVIWIKNPNDKNGDPIKDTKNPDEKLRSRTILNAVILTGFVYKDDIWDDGKVYDPKSGKTYSSTMKLKGDRLEIRGYVGFSMFGKTTVWQRVN